MTCRFIIKLFILLALVIPVQAFQQVSSGTVKGNTPSKKITADVSGIKDLYLIATDGGNGNGSDHAVWCNPVLTDASGKKVSLTELKPFFSIAGWNSVKLNKTPSKKPLKIGDKSFSKGFFAHAPSVIAFKLDGKYRKFEAEVGIQSGKAGSCDFIVAEKNIMKKPDVIPDFKAVELAIKDLTRRFGRKYPNGKKYLGQLKKIAAMPKGDERMNKLLALQRTALLENPLLKDFGKILAVRRKYGSSARKVGSPCTPGDAYSLESINVKSGNDELVTITDFSQTAKVKSLFKPRQGGHIAEIDLHFNGDKIMYSGLGSEGNWHLHEVTADGKYLSQITPKGVPYNSFDSCYLPDGRVIYTSTAPMQGLPCESGRIRMSNTYQIDPKTQKIRRLTYDQDANWNPTVMPDGKVLFQRWDYSDLPHFFSRTLMTMNPDGSVQKMYYGSNSYWPNAIFNAKPIPGSNSKIIGVVSGHHTSRPGPLCIFDVRKGRFEADGAVQLIPGYKKNVDPVIADYLYAGFYPKFLSPLPLGTNSSNGAGKYFLVSCKPTKDSLWGIYLVDIYDNIVKIAEEEGYALNEPIPFVKTKLPPVIPDRVKLDSKTANVYIANIYEGPGLKNIPKGKVKKLRLFTYHFSYYKSGSHEAVGCEASWDVKRILGTVPVNPDGSAIFQVPANTPIAIQPIDEDGAALQLMRSWITPMPGETVACIGCHEDPSMAPTASRGNMASRSKPVKIDNWQGPERNFSFLREVQPVLNKRCISCHNHSTEKTLANGKKIPDFKTLKLEKLVYEDQYKSKGNAGGGPFSVSYNNLNRYIRRPGPESDYHLFNPMEFHSSTSPLLQTLDRGHHGVELTRKEREKLVAWIDFNVPFWGSWTDTHRNWANEMHRNWSGSGRSHEEQLKNIANYQEIRRKLQKQYANITVDFETDQYSLDQACVELAKIKTVVPKAKPVKTAPVKVGGWPFKASASSRKEVKVDNKTIALRKVPAGSFVMGSNNYQDSTPCSVKIDTFWMAETEVTNELFTMFKKDHDSGVMDEHGKDHTRPGIEAKTPSLPVIRVSWNEAVAFTKWLSKKTGKKFRLPTEAEWEFAARAGSDKDFYWGDINSDFSMFANFADKTIEKFNARQTFNFILREDKFNDNAQIQTQPGKYKPNAFGLYDMLGNVAEWTNSDYNPYPFKPVTTANKKKVVRGGSWHDLPHWAGVAARIPYEPYQRVYNVGIRLVLDEN